MEGLIPFKSSIDQKIASLYFMRVSSSFCSSDSVNVAEIITGFALSSYKKAYFYKKIFEKIVLEVSKRVRFVFLTLSKCSFKTHVYSLRYNEI